MAPARAASSCLALAVAVATLCSFFATPSPAAPATGKAGEGSIEERVLEKIKVLRSLEDLERKAKELEASRLRRDEIANGWAITLGMSEIAGHGPPRASARNRYMAS